MENGRQSRYVGPGANKVSLDKRSIPNQQGKHSVNGVEIGSDEIIKYQNKTMNLYNLVMEKAFSKCDIKTRSHRENNYKYNYS